MNSRDARAAVKVVRQFGKPVSQEDFPHVLVRYDEGAVVFEAANGTMACSIPIAHEGQPFAPIVARSSTLRRILPPLRASEISVTSDEEGLQLAGPAYEATLPSSATATDWPVWPEQGETVATFLMSGLREAVNTVGPVISTDHTRPDVAQIHLEFGLSEVTVVATDGFDLCLYRVGPDHHYEGWHETWIVNLSPTMATNLRDVLNLLSIRRDDRETVVTVTAQDGGVMFTLSNGARVLSLRAGHKFPDWRHIVGKATTEATARALFDMDDLHLAVSTLSPRPYAWSAPLRIEIGADALRLHADMKGARLVPSVPAVVYGPAGHEVIADIRRTRQMSKRVGGGNTYLHYNPDDQAAPLVWETTHGMIVSMPYRKG